MNIFAVIVIVLVAVVLVGSVLWYIAYHKYRSDPFFRKAAARRGGAGTKA